MARGDAAGLVGIGELSGEREIQNSDEEASDSSLEDLGALLASRVSEIRARKTPATELVTSLHSSGVTPRRRQRPARYRSPTQQTPTYKYDLHSLAKAARREDATEASAQRVQELWALEKETTGDESIAEAMGSSSTAVGEPAAWQSVISKQETSRRLGRCLQQAVEPTEFEARPQRWYFFAIQTPDTEAPQATPFPLSSLPVKWRVHLEEPGARDDAFLSGFVEDMVAMGKTLPNQLLLWLLDESCRQKSDFLRSAYLNVLRQSACQLQLLIDTELIQQIFVNLGATEQTTDITHNIESVKEIPDYYSRSAWPALRAILQFFTDIAHLLQQESLAYIACLLLRMSIDSIVVETVDLYVTFQQIVCKLCCCTSCDYWDDLCIMICTSLLNTLELPSLRLQVVESIPSIVPRSHDLRRRLALCFLFNDSTYAKSHPHQLADLSILIERLEQDDFQSRCYQDYRQLKALVMLLDIAADDGQSSQRPISDPAVETNFNDDVEQFSASVRRLLGGIGAPQTGYISKIQAKEMIEMISQRIIHTMRTKPKPVHEWFVDSGKSSDGMPVERQRMADFVAKIKGAGTGDRGL
ncbi:unnamed protein product [Blumeria hordei]|uniref:Uncharacterized protein n=1 Tax=Blumeria hordei TaxID=2867405 RepID=A0A383V0G1_BLUHO|nr:unnamed protein product [Blumeria hordei]